MRGVHAVRVVGATLLVTSTIVAAPTPLSATTVQAAREVRLSAATAAVAPSDFYRRIAAETVTNAGDLWQSFAAQPFPIAQVAVGNQAAFVSDLVDTLGGVFQGEYPLTELLAPVGDAIATASRNVVTVALGLTAALPVLTVSVVLPVLSTVVSAAFAIADIVRAAVDLDVVGLIDAIVNVPGWIVNGFLNGTVIPNEAVPLAIPGVLTSENAFPATGPVATLVNRTQGIADRMARYPTAAPADSADITGDGADATGEDVDVPTDDLRDLNTTESLDTADPDTADEVAEEPETSTAAPSDEDVESSETTVTENDVTADVSTRRGAGTTRTGASAATPQVSPPTPPDDRTQ